MVVAGAIDPGILAKQFSLGLSSEPENVLALPYGGFGGGRLAWHFKMATTSFGQSELGVTLSKISTSSGVVGLSSQSRITQVSGESTFPT